MPYSPSEKPSTSMEEPSYLTPNKQPLNIHSENIPKRFSFNINNPADDAISVFVRIKGAEAGASYVDFDVDEKCVIVKKNKFERQFRFTHVFPPTITQNEMFEQCAKTKLQRLLDGKDSFIFTYGASNSGKSFTVHGEINSLGLIPRTLVLLFSTLRGSIDHLSPLVPDMASSVISMSETEISERLSYRKKLLGHIKQYLPYMAKNETFVSYDAVEDLQSEMPDMLLSYQRGVYSIWVSYYEIYNEKVHDLIGLLDEPKVPLRLMPDKEKKFYIKDLKYIEVGNLYEAYLIYAFGRHNLSVFSTGVNCRSSRSHSVFTVKLIGRPEGDTSSYFQHSSFSICDLAGTERANKTKNFGMRMKEAQRINSSFLVLNKCLRIIRENQELEVKKIVPYRESKLTQILGPSLTSGQVRLTMIVTISQDDLHLEETETTLKSSSVATAIKVCSPPPVKIPKKRFSMALSNCPRGKPFHWAAVASQLHESKATPQSGSEPDVYKELMAEKKKRVEAEEMIELLKEAHKKEIKELEKKFRQEISQKISADLVEEHEKTVRDMGIELLKAKKQNRLYREELEIAKEELEKVQAYSKNLEELLDDAKEEVESFREEISSKEALLVQKNEEINFYKTEINDLEDVRLRENQHFENQISELTSEIEHNSRFHSMQLRQAQDEIEMLKKKISELERDKKYQIPVIELSDSETQDCKKNTRGRSKLKATYIGKQECIKKEVPKIHIVTSSDEEKEQIKNHSANNSDQENKLPLPRTPENSYYNTRYRTRSAERWRSSPEENPEFLMPHPRTTAKKKKKQNKKVPKYYEESIDSSTKELNGSSKSKKKLFFRSSDLANTTETSKIEDLNETQQSPGTLMKRALRSRKL